MTFGNAEARPRRRRGRHRGRGVAAWCLLVAASLTGPSACGGDRGGGQGAFGLCQQSVAWGGWDGTPTCAGLAASVITAEDRACQTDADCRLVAVTSCAAHAVNQPALARYSQLPTPCQHPLGGMCPVVNYRAWCNQGCCAPVNAAAPLPLPGTR
ncbi:MAG: hypothetical protein AAGN82_22955 [Myxococcota bacterium]